MSNGFPVGLCPLMRLLPGRAWLISSTNHDRAGSFAPRPTASSRRICTTTNRSACASRDGTHPLALQTLGELPAAQHQYRAGLCRDTPSHVPHGSSRSSSRHLCAGHHLAKKSGTRQAHPGLSLKARFRCHLLPNDAYAVNPPKREGLSMQRLLDPHLTPRGRLFPPAHHDSLQLTQRRAV